MKKIESAIIKHLLGNRIQDSRCIIPPFFWGILLFFLAGEKGIGRFMVNMELEELIYQCSVCGIWADQVDDLSVERVIAVLKKESCAHHIAYCMTGHDSLSLAQWLESFRNRFPLYRLVVINNPKWCQNEPLRIQNTILQCIERADIFLPCSFPREDAFNYLLLCCQTLLIHRTAEKQLGIIEKWRQTGSAHVIYV